MRVPTISTAGLLLESTLCSKVAPSKPDLIGHGGGREGQRLSLANLGESLVGKESSSGKKGGGQTSSLVQRPGAE